MGKGRGWGTMWGQSTVILYLWSQVFSTFFLGRKMSGEANNIKKAQYLKWPFSSCPSWFLPFFKIWAMSHLLQEACPDALKLGQVAIPPYPNSLLCMLPPSYSCLRPRHFFQKNRSAWGPGLTQKDSSAWHWGGIPSVVDEHIRVNHVMNWDDLLWVGTGETRHACETNQVKTVNLLSCISPGSGRQSGMWELEAGHEKCP